MTAQAIKELFWNYIDSTPVEEIKPLEDLTINYLLRKKIGIEK